MNFSIFRDFFRIFKTVFLIIIFFRFLIIKINKKIKKRGARGPRGCDVARKATWQRHVDPRCAPTWREYILYYIILIYIKGVFVLPYMGRVIPLETVGLFKPDGFSNIFRVGLTHTYLPFRWRGTTRSERSRSEDADKIDAWTTELDQTRAWLGEL